MPYRIIMYFILGLLLGSPTFAQEVVLDYPSGRFQEDKPPAFFKWSLYGDAKSLTMKVFRRNPDGSIDRATNLLARFDFLSDVQSFAWPLEPLGRGQYVWTMDGYDDKNPHFLFHQEMDFEIEPMTYLDLSTQRYGLQVGFSRGNYTSRDSSFVVDFQTTPTIYGFLYHGGNTYRVWDLSAFMSDFTVRGAVRRTFSGFGSYSYRISSPNSSRIDFFLGPTLRSFTFPRVQTADGVSISTTDVTQVSPGLILSAQKRFDFKITLYTQLMVDIPVLASVKSVSSSQQIGYGANGGLLFGQFWPLAFGGELQYRVDRSTTFEGTEPINVKMEGLSLVLNTTYAF